MVDGAHTLGQLSIDFKQWDVDFFVSNGHKWFCNNRGAGILYVKESLHKIIKPVVLSWGNSLGFHSEFIWSGKYLYKINYFFYFFSKNLFYHFFKVILIFGLIYYFSIFYLFLFVN